MSDSLYPEEPEDAADEAPWRPVWEDEEAGPEMAVPPWISPSRARSLRRREPDWSALLVPLAAAEDALSRLDAAAEAACPALREGLVARLAFAEAAGWLAAAADRAWIHPRDLALAEAGLLGDFSAAALGGRGAAALPATSGVLGTPGRARALLAEATDRLPDGTTLAQGLALARALRRLASTGWDPLASPEVAAAALAPLTPEGADVTALRLWPERFAAWRSAALAVPRAGQPPGPPPLLAAAEAASAWLTAEVLQDSRPTPAQALLLAAAAARRRGRLRVIPLPFWSLGPTERPTILPLGDHAAWPAVFLNRVAAAAQRGLAELTRLREAEAAAARLVAASRQSLLPAAAEAALRAPALTARGLARQLGVTPQGALLLLQRLQGAGVLREGTGRRSFRAYVVQ
ncbi:helix-turn-helix domain-containing protein [Siccirubricoccus sp. G192]|uniref:helix-turn-helix domain-containing protein n=1 Tax=Siccirubricoccus sp. G192 TaxID=2849651 RepID=UPI001C2C52A2|nr:helix-turn-helix domain-containing protein [Siccirubricoccus sp. G192]MBV1800605.1 hypothetical protein [Siccirubricoccus sp. G192]MBV1800669.1 hypothetical protein [Siccirubricoccus sp. G192]